MARSPTEVTKKRLSWVNQEYARIVKGSHMSNPQKTRLFRKLHKQSKKKFPMK